jgi:thiol-disulfide isomerase/thioredoxin
MTLPMPRPRALLPYLLLLALAACGRGQPPPASTNAKPPVAPVATAPAKPAAPADETAKVPELKVTTLDGKAFDLAAHRGRWVVVNFWATWCGPCLKEMPDLSALDAMRENVEVIGLAYEDIEPAAMKAFLEHHPVVYPVAILDVYAPPPAFATPRGLPTTYLIAPDGTVAKHFLGPVTAAELDAAIAGAGSAKAG